MLPDTNQSSTYTCDTVDFDAPRLSSVGGKTAHWENAKVTRLVKDQTPLGINLYRITASLPMVVMLSCMLETPTLPRDIVVSFLEPSFDSALASFD